VLLLFGERGNNMASKSVGSTMTRRFSRDTPQAEAAIRFRRQYVWMSEQNLTRHLSDAYLVDAQPPGPVATRPAPPSTPTRTSCAPGTAVDLGTARCAPVCRSGAAPFMGQCWLG